MSNPQQHDPSEANLLAPRGTFLAIEWRLDRIEQGLNKVTDDHERRLRELERFMASIRAFAPIAAVGLAVATAFVTRWLGGP